jgi:hypothetical protein
VIELRGYLDGSGRKPFESWFETLDPTAAAKVTVALTRIEQGNPRTRRQSVRESMNTGSSSDPAIGSTSEGTEIGS